MSERAGARVLVTNEDGAVRFKLPSNCPLHSRPGVIAKAPEARRNKPWKCFWGSQR